MVFTVLLGVPNNFGTVSLIEWGAFTLALWAQQTLATGDTVAATNTAVQAASAGGWLWEIPNFIYKGRHILRYNKQYTYFISFQLLSLPILLYLIRPKPTKATLAATGFYLFYCICMTQPTWRLLFINPLVGNWITHIPTMLMLTTAITEAQK